MNKEERRKRGVEGGEWQVEEEINQNRILETGSSLREPWKVDSAFTTFNFPHSTSVLLNAYD
jgi:hypothetical protein